MEIDTVSFTVWSPRGANITNKKLGQAVSTVLKDKLPPGMVIEGYYSHRDKTFRMTEITYSSVLRSEVKKSQPSGLELNELMSKPSEGMTFLSRTPLNEDVCQSHQDSGDLQEVRLVEEITFYDPSLPCRKPVKVLQLLPPDDWSLEEIPIGQRVIVFAERGQDRVSIDLREVPYDMRRKALECLCGRMELPQVKVVPVSTSRFPEFIQGCRKRRKIDVVGVMAKRRSGNYVSSERDSGSKHSNWLYHLVKKSSKE